MQATPPEQKLIGIAAIIGLLGTLVVPATVRADRPTRETMTPATWHLTYNKGPEIELLSSPPQVQVQLDGPSSHGGVTPFTVPGNLRGNYTVAASKPGFVHATGRFDFVLDAENQLPTSAPMPTGRSALMLALSPPGWVEWNDGNRFQGAVLTATELAAAGGLVWAHRQRVDADSRSVSLSRQAADASGDRQDELHISARHAQQQAESWRRIEFEWMGLGGGLWLVNYLARAPMSADLETSFDAEGKLALNLKPLKRSAATLRSFLMPGWGQAYGGRLRAGRSFLAGTMSLAIGTVLADQAYQRAASDAIYADQYLEHVRKIDPDQTTTAQNELAHAMRVADSAWSTRNLTLGLTAAVWTYNLLDAFLFTRGAEPIAREEIPVEPEGPVEPEAEPEFSLLSPISGRLGIQVTF